MCNIIWRADFSEMYLYMYYIYVHNICTYIKGLPVNPVCCAPFPVSYLYYTYYKANST